MVYTILIYMLLVFGVILGLVVLLNNKKNLNNIVFFLLSVSLSMWFLTNYFVEQNFNSPLFWTKVTFFFAAWTIGFFVLFALIFPVAKLRKRFILFGIITALVSILSCTPYVVNGLIQRVSSTGAIGYDVDKGPLYIIYTLFILVSVVIGVAYLIVKLVKSKGAEKNKLRIFTAGAVISVVLGLILNLIIPLVTGSSESSRYGFLAAVVLLSFTSYAILRHRFLDIRLVVVRALTYLLSVLVIGVMYGLIAFNLISPLTTHLAIQQQQLVYTMLAILLAFTYAPIVNFFSKITNRIFYRDKYNAQVLVNNIGKILASEIDLDKVSHAVVQEVTRQMKIDKGEIVVFGEKQLFYENTVFQSNNANISQKELRKLGRGMLVSDELQSAERKDIMQRYGISISVALRTSERFIGYLLLGDKKGGDIYNDEDLSVIKIIGSELSVAAQNALSYKEIQLFSETLAERVRERTAQLNTANEQLRLLDQAKDEFISMASHQLRTPLTTVKGYASMLEEGDFGKLTREQHEKVDLTLDGANRMARLIDDLLNVSRMDANRFFLEVSEVDIVSLVAQELQQLQTLAESKKVKITYIPPTKKAINIRLDENKTRQVVMNLIDNSIHYSQPPAGGGEVQVSLGVQKDHIVFMVRDNGIGVPADVQKRLFTKMFRANNAKSARPDGTGLGLYLVKRVVEDEGGEIIFESTEGKGSTFGFRLPLSGVSKSVEEQSMKIGARVAAHPKG